MSAVQPFEAWFFFGADDTTEVDQEYAQVGWDDDGVSIRPTEYDLVSIVTVIAVESSIRGEEVWFLRDGKIEVRPSWMVRTPSDGLRPARVTVSA